MCQVVLLVADLAEKLGIAIIAAIPMKMDQYRTSTSGQARRDHHWREAVLSITLPEVLVRGTDKKNQYQYEQLGVLLARRSHILLALWDGQTEPESSRKLGGTSDVVRIRQEGTRRSAGLCRSELFDDADTSLDATGNDPIVRVHTPRASAACCGPDLCDAGSVFVLNTAGMQPEYLVHPPGSVPDLLSAAMASTWAPLAAFNGRIRDFDTSDMSIFRMSKEYLRSTPLPPIPEVLDLTDDLKGFQAAADAAAQYFQGALLGHFAPANPRPEPKLGRGLFTALFGRPARLLGMIDRSRSTWRDHRRRPRLGVVFLFALAIPAIAAIVEWYVHFHGGLTAIFLYLFATLGGLGYYFGRVEKREWQNRFQDYRGVAEALRVQLYWGLAAVPRAVSEHYPPRHRDETAWIKACLRGPSLWALALALKLPAPCQQAVTRGWIQDQQDYFKKRAAVHKHSARSSEEWARKFLLAGFFFAFLLLGYELLDEFKEMTDAKAHLRHILHEYHKPLEAAAIVSPAIAAAFRISSEYRNHEPHLHAYTAMWAIFGRARVKAEAIGLHPFESKSASRFQDLVFLTGREALAENAEWLASHRLRLLEPKP